MWKIQTYIYVIEKILDYDSTHEISKPGYRVAWYPLPEQMHCLATRGL